jgi:WD40 repeat protein
MEESQFLFDVFLSHSTKDKPVVRAIAERLRGDGLRVWFDEWELKPGDSIPAKIEGGLEHSRVLVLCMSANAFGSDWAALEAGTFRFRDPLNKERRFIPVRLDGTPVKGSLAQFLYVDWFSAEREEAYAKLLEVCREPEKPTMVEADAVCEQIAEKAIQLDYEATIYDYVFSPDGKLALTGATDKTVRLWEVNSGRCLRVFKGHTDDDVWALDWSADQRRILSGDGSDDGSIRLWDVETERCLRTLKGHTSYVIEVAFSADGHYAASCASDRTIRLWDLETGHCLRVLEGHSGAVKIVVWSVDQRSILSGSYDTDIRLWNMETGECLRVLKGHTNYVDSLAWSSDHRIALSGSKDNTIRMWNLETGQCLRIFEGHTGGIRSLAWSVDPRRFLSGANDGTVRLWDIESGRCLSVYKGTKNIATVTWLADHQHACFGDVGGRISVWNLAEFVTAIHAPKTIASTLSPAPDQIQYTNAKVLLVGDTSAGKTGLAHRLATGEWKPSDGSTVGAWSTQWKLNGGGAAPGIQREIWLWDFGGQADQRLIHQLYMDRSALILLLFNADQEDVLPGLRDWLTALRRCVPAGTPQFLVAGRTDAGFKASRGKLQNFAKEHNLSYHETSSLAGTGCKELHTAILSAIPWETLPITSTEWLFKRIKDEILALRDEGQVLHTFKELRDLLWHRLPKEARFEDDTLRTVIDLLDGPGAVKELNYGTYILLQPEWINAYAQAVIRTLRADESELGCLPLRSIAEGKLVYQSVGRDGGIVDMKRLPLPEERVVLGEMERQLLERGLCLRQGDKLVFPSHCGRDRSAVVEHPSVFVSYVVKGYLDDIYATLAVKLADSESFRLKELWRDAADFDTLAGGHRMGIKLTRESASNGDISVYFGPGVTQQEQVIFANYIHAHLEGRSEQVQRLRYYVCPHCHTPKGNPQVLMKKLLDKGQAADTECDGCGNRFLLWDTLEKTFASTTIRERAEGLQAEDAIRLDTRRKGKLLALEVAARITSADQKCFEIPGVEDEGLDMEVEFTEADGSGAGKRIYLQLKAGNSYLEKRKSDGAEIFRIKKQNWVKYWLKQNCPVLLVIGTFGEEDEWRGGREKLEFADVRWMEIGELLRQKSENGKKQVTQIVFEGKRLDAMSVRDWRNKALNG